MEASASTTAACLKELAWSCRASWEQGCAYWAVLERWRRASFQVRVFVSLFTLATELQAATHVKAMAGAVGCKLPK